ncbi:MAG: putative metal-dependent hydrolase [Gemmatimonadaceae bacterium]|nr:putative metal-dependent hydrolase [Gemmatimonadaceae bacterium]
MTAPIASSGPDLRYPVGRMVRTPMLSLDERRAAIDELAQAPERLRAAVRGLSDDQLDTPYRPDGWTVRQLVHHVADSHMHAYARVRFALTEQSPTIKPYAEAAWAELADARDMPITGSLALLEALHDRLVHLLRAIPVDAFARTLVHPENGPMTIDALLSVYSWHGRHHTAHVTALRERMRWA